MNGKKNISKQENPKFDILLIDGSEYKTMLNKKFRERKKWEIPDDKKIISYIPGTIISINLTEKQIVKEGDLLIVLESMKMRNRVLIPSGGRIKKLHVSEGQKIPKGHLIAELE